MSLQPLMIPECLQKFSDLEKQLIVKNLIFIKVCQLPKTRMQAINDRVINVPVKDMYNKLLQIFNLNNYFKLHVCLYLCLCMSWTVYPSKN